MSSRHSPTPVFDSRQSAYHTFRIPAIVSSPGYSATSPGDRVLLAFCEGRIDSAADSGRIDVVLRRSNDGGRTWDDLKVVSSEPDKTCGNPTPLIDESSGDIVLVTVRNGARVPERSLSDQTADPEDRRRVWLQRSTDLGTSWSSPVEITQQVSKNDWGWYATGPCHGVTLRHPKYLNRMVVPANHTVVPGQQSETARSGGHCLYSDDGGHQWRLGYVFDTADDKINVNETSVVELADGRLIFNARNHRGTGAARVHAASTDGGQTLSDPFRCCSGEFTPDVQGSVLSVDSETILLSCPADPQRRRELTLYSSDDGANWQKSVVINPGPSGYSDLVQVGGTEIGVLFEAGETDYREQIRFTTVRLDDPEPNGDRGSAGAVR